MMNKNKKRISFCINDNSKINHFNSGFTIVELLVVIVVIGILAAVTIVSYTGISGRAKVSAIQSDLSNASKQIKLFQATDANGDYPTTNNCPTTGTNEICLKSSNDNTFAYASNNTANPKVFALNATNGTTVYSVTNNSSPAAGAASFLAITDPTNWLTVGTQVWAKSNLNVGTMVPGTLGQPNTTNQTDDGITEKYCYLNDPANCTTYGGLYQWKEAMKYATAEGAQGICPVGSHIPTDKDWKILEMQLGITQAQADIEGARGTGLGAKLKVGGSSGLEVLIAGRRSYDGSMNGLLSYTLFWSSSYVSYTAWSHGIGSSSQLTRYNEMTSMGNSVRCIGN